MSSIAMLPVGSLDLPFIFNQMTGDFQPVTVQGQLTYQIVDPRLTASLLDFTIDGTKMGYLSEDPEKLAQHLVNLTQVLIRGEISNRTLHDALKSPDLMASEVVENLNQSDIVSSMGLRILNMSILAIKPSPEIARALEADTRELLLRGADDALYERRNSAIEQERRIKENELNTEIAVEEKHRKIREMKVEADLSIEKKEQEIRREKLLGQIDLESERKKLILEQAKNTRAQADAESYVLESSLAPLKVLKPKLLEAISLQSAEPRLMVANALKEIAQNAGRIGQLNISPDLLENLLMARREEGLVKD